MFLNYQDEIKELQKKCYECKICPLGQKEVDMEDPHVFASGKVPADIMVITEIPKKIETIKKIPLCDISGQQFNNEMLPLIGLTRKDIYVSNAVKCRPERNRIPTNQEIIICRFHIDAEIALIDPKLIITLGNPALWAMCGIKGIIKNHGKIYQSRKWSNGKTYNVFALYHPSFVLQNRGKSNIQKEIQIDLINLKKIVGEL